MCYGLMHRECSDNTFKLRGISIELYVYACVSMHAFLCMPVCKCVCHSTYRLICGKLVYGLVCTDADIRAKPCTDRFLMTTKPAWPIPYILTDCLHPKHQGSSLHTCTEYRPFLHYL